MNFIRYTKDYITRRFVKYLTIIVFISMGFIAISTFYLSRYTFIKTDVKVPVFLTIHQGIIFRCNQDLKCFTTNLSKEDFFKNKQTIDKISTESLLIIDNATENYISFVCKGFYKNCDNSKIADITKDLFNIAYKIENKKNAIHTVYNGINESLKYKTKMQKNCTFFTGNKSLLKTTLPCSIGQSNFSITGSVLLQNIYNNISYTEEGITKKDFFDYYIKYTKSIDTINNWFDFRFLTNSNSVNSDFAGIKNSLYGSFATIGISLLFSVVIATLAALYLQEFWVNKRSVLRRIVIINIDNMSAIPSILCGLLGAVLYINILHLPRSSILVGAFTISFMIFPLIVISARNAIMSVPKDVKDLAYSMGASQCRVAFCHTLPMSINGIITGTLLTVGKAAGETACLLIVGLTAFSQELPKSIFDSTSTIATQVYTWMEMPDINFQYRIYAGMSLLILISFSLSLFVRTIGYYGYKKKK